MPRPPYVPIPGLVEPGNIDLTKRPRVKNPDGTTSTIRSIGKNIDGHEVVLPTITPDGKNLTEAQAVERYRLTGEHLGKFASVDTANWYAERLHEAQARELEDTAQ